MLQLVVLWKWNCTLVKCSQSKYIHSGFRQHLADVTTTNTRAAVRVVAGFGSWLFTEESTASSLSRCRSPWTCMGQHNVYTCTPTAPNVHMSVSLDGLRMTTPSTSGGFCERRKWNWMFLCVGVGGAQINCSACYYLFVRMLGVRALFAARAPQTKGPSNMCGLFFVRGSTIQ